MLEILRAMDGYQVAPKIRSKLTLIAAFAIAALENSRMTPVAFIVTIVLPVTFFEVSPMTKTLRPWSSLLGLLIFSDVGFAS